MCFFVCLLLMLIIVYLTFCLEVQCTPLCSTNYLLCPVNMVIWTENVLFKKILRASCFKFFSQNLEWLLTSSFEDLSFNSISSSFSASVLSASPSCNVKFSICLMCRSTVSSAVLRRSWRLFFSSVSCCILISCLVDLQYSQKYM